MTRHDPAEAGPSKQVGTWEQDTGDHRQTDRTVIELAAAHDLGGWNPDLILDAFEAGEIQPEHFTIAAYRKLAETVVEMITDGEPPLPEAIYNRLRSAGSSHEEAVELVLVPGGWEAAGRRCDGVRFHLGRLAEQVERERLQARLVGLADSLHRPGGPARVAAALGVAS